MSDFVTQAESLKVKFVEKGYSPAKVDEDIDPVFKTDRNSLIVEKPKRPPDDRFKWAFTTQYSVQHKRIKSILNQHWNVLKSDSLLGPVLPDRPGVVFRGAMALRNKLAPNVSDPPTKPSFFPEMIGFHACRRCNVCLLNVFTSRRIDSFTSTVTSTIYHMRDFVTCDTRYVVYLLTCPCKKQYVGRTIRTFAIRVNEHITRIRLGKTNHSVPKHYLEHHHKKPEGTSFQIIGKFTPHWRGESKIRGVSQLEMFWIYRLRCLFPHGLNIE